MEEGVIPAKLKRVTQICVCIEGEFVIVLCSCFGGTKMLGKATSNQALTKVKCTHIHTFTLTYTHAALPQGLKQRPESRPKLH